MEALYRRCLFAPPELATLEDREFREEWLSPAGDADDPLCDAIRAAAGVEAVVHRSPVAGRRRRVAVVFHGNSEVMRLRPLAEFAAALAAAAGIDVVLPEYPGYDVGQRPRLEQVIACGAAVLRAVLDQGVGLVVVGYSLGTAIAIKALRALDRPARALVLVAPFCSALSAYLTGRWVGLSAACLYAPLDELRVAPDLAALRLPLFVAYATKRADRAAGDGLFDPSHARCLWAASPAPPATKMLYECAREGLDGHNTMRGDPELVAAIAHFLAAVTREPPVTPA